MSYTRLIAEGDVIFELLGDIPDDTAEWQMVAGWRDEVRASLDPLTRMDFDAHMIAPPIDPTYTPQRRLLWHSLGRLHKIAGY